MRSETADVESKPAVRCLGVMEVAVAVLAKVALGLGRCRIGGSDIASHLVYRIVAGAAVASLVYAQSARATANLASVAGAIGHAATHDVLLRSAIALLVLVVAVALAGVLETGEGVAFALAVVDASLHGHVIRGGRGAGEGASVVVVGGAALVGKVERLGDVGEVGLRKADLGLVDASLVWRCVLRAVCWGVAAREMMEYACHLLVDGWWDAA